MSSANYIIYHIVTNNTLIKHKLFMGQVLHYLYDIEAVDKLILPRGKRSEGRVNRKSDL